MYQEHVRHIVWRQESNAPSRNAQIDARSGFRRLKGVKRTLIFIVRDRPFEEARGNPLPTTLYHLLHDGDALRVGGRRTERGDCDRILIADRQDPGLSLMTPPL